MKLRRRDDGIEAELTFEELEYLMDALVSAAYSETDPQYQNNGFTHSPHSDVAETTKTIETWLRLHDELEKAVPALRLATRPPKMCDSE